MLVNSKREICIEGYPRSANSFVFHSLMIINPYIKIAGHTHTIANIKSAFKYNIPVYILIRKPIDAIASYIFRRTQLTNKKTKRIIFFAIEDYRQFYEFVLKNKDKIKILYFEEIINKPENILNNIKQIEMPDPKSINFEKVSKQSFEIIQSFKSQKEFKKSSIPDKRRTQYIEEVKIILRENYFDELKKLDYLFYLIHKEIK